MQALEAQATANSLHSYSINRWASDGEKRHSKLMKNN